MNAYDLIYAVRSAQYSHGESNVHVVSKAEAPAFHKIWNLMEQLAPLKDEQDCVRELWLREMGANKMIKKSMYMITFYDRCCSPIADGTASFFTEDIVKFKDDFFHIPGESELKELFSRSLGGEIIIYYYSDDPKLNMLQSDTADVFAEKRFAFTDRTYELENAYHFESFIRVVKTVIHVQSIRFKNLYYLIGKYHLHGVARPDNWGGVTHYAEAWTEGNPILVNRTPAVLTMTDDRPPKVMEENYHFEKYKDNEIYSICYVPFRYGDAPLEIPEDLTEDDFIELMRDIPGEAG